MHQIEVKPKETKEEAFHRIMDRHMSALRDRYRKMRRTLNSQRLTASDGDLICLAVEGVTSKFTSVVKSRIEDEEEDNVSIWQ